LAAWKTDRLRAGAEHNEPFLASLIPGRVVKTFSRRTLIAALQSGVSARTDADLDGRAPRARCRAANSR